MRLCEGVATRIKELLEEKNMTAYKLFKQSGVNQCTISNILNLKIENVSLRIIMELCQGFGIELSNFFDSPCLKVENIID